MILSRRSALTGIGLAGLGLTGFTPALARGERIHATGPSGSTGSLQAARDPRPRCGASL